MTISSCALFFFSLVMALERTKRNPSTSRRERHGCVRQVFFVSCATSLARMKGRSVSPLFVKTQRVGLGMFADVASLTLGAAPRRITGCLQPRSPNIEARVNHPLRKPASSDMIRPRCCAELQIVSCTWKKLGRMCATQECVESPGGRL